MGYQTIGYDLHDALGSEDDQEDVFNFFLF